MANMKSTDITKLSKQLQQSESKTILDEMDSLANSEEYQKKAPPETQQQLSNAIQQARDAYEKETTKNDWLDIAQTLAGAVAQYGAASQGMRGGYDASNLKMAPNTNWEARNRRALDFMNTSNKLAQDEADATRQRHLDEEKLKASEFAQKYSPLEARLKNAQQIESDAERLKREEAQNNKQMERDDLREKLQNQRLSAQDLDRQIEGSNKQLISLQTLAQNMNNSDDLTKKDAAKLTAQYGKLAGEAGLDLAELSATDKPGKLWGTNPDPEARRKLIDEKIRTLKDSISALREKKMGLLGQGKPATQEESTTVRIQAPDGSIAEVPKDKAKKYLDKGGKIVQ